MTKTANKNITLTEDFPIIFRFYEKMVRTNMLYIGEWRANFWIENRLLKMGKLYPVKLFLWPKAFTNQLNGQGKFAWESKSINWVVTYKLIFPWLFNWLPKIYRKNSLKFLHWDYHFCLLSLMFSLISYHLSLKD